MSRALEPGLVRHSPETIVQLENVLDAAQLKHMRQALAGARWIDGRATAGHLSYAAKQNRQLEESDPLAVRLGHLILNVLERHPVFMSMALPAAIVPPLFNAYRGREHYGRHIDGAVRPIAGHDQRVRTDLSVTVFLSEPHEYDGGELVIEEPGGRGSRYKLSAGSLVLYPSTSVHYVEPVTRGERLASFFWVQSLVRENERREMLFSLDSAIQRLRQRHPQEESVVDLTAHYHNLLRLWADVR